MDESIVQQQRFILNSNKGISNIIGSKVIRTDFQRVAKHLFEVLLDHYGPYSKFAAIEDNAPMSETQFTKDGINIVRAIEYVSPQEDWVRKTIAYIGTKMESAVGDGTTSAMMFTCAMLYHMTETIDEITGASYNQLYTEIKKWIKLVSVDLDKAALKVDNDDLFDLVGDIVYNQTYTSSHGDTELAEALSDVYCHTPKVLWDRMTYRQRKYESDQRLYVVKSEGQFTMKGEIFTSAMNNKEFCSWMEYEHATLLVINDSLRFDSSVWPDIEKIIDESTPDAPVVILCAPAMDETTYQQVNEKLIKMNRENRTFVIITQEIENPRINDFVTLQCLMGADITKMTHGEASAQKDVYVKFKDKKVVLDHLYVAPDEYAKAHYRPHAIDGKHPQFSDYTENVKHMIDMYARGDATPDNRRKLSYFSNIYAKCMYTEISTLEIGGNTYDNVAMVDVVDDALRASSRALKYGVVYGNNRSLYNCCWVKHAKHNDTYVTRWFAKCVKASLEDIAEGLLSKLYPNEWFSKRRKRNFVDWWFSHNVDLLSYSTSSSDGLPVYWDHQFFGDEITYPAVNMKKNYIYQPANTDIVMLERFVEVALKFVLTERIIVHGGAYVDKKRK